MVSDFIRLGNQIFMADKITTIKEFNTTDDDGKAFFGVEVSMTDGQVVFVDGVSFQGLMKELEMALNGGYETK